MEADLLAAFDRRIEQAGYTSRSEAIRDIVRSYLVDQELQQSEARVVATLTLIYDHHARQLEDRLTQLQHDHHDAIRCTTHVHLDSHNCLEVVILAGSAAQVKDIADSLLSIRGVEHGKLVMTLAGGVP